MSPAEASLAKYREHLIDIENRRHLLAMRKYEEEPGRGETEAEMKARIAKTAAEEEFGRKKTYAGIIGITKKDKEDIRKEEAERKISFAKFEQGLKVSDYMFKRKEESTERGLANMFKKVMTDKARADMAIDKARVVLDENRLKLDREEFSWNSQMDQATLLRQYAEMQGDTELAYNLAEYEAGVKKALVAEQQGKKMHALTMQAAEQVGYSVYLFYKSEAMKDKDGTKAAMKAIDFWNAELSRRADKLDGMEIKTGKTEWIDRQWPRKNVPTPLQPSEYNVPPPTEPGEIELPALERTPAPGFTGMPTASTQKDVDAAIKELKDEVEVPFTPETMAVLLKRFTPAQIEEIQNGLAP
jgi:hypothetical protein